MTIHDLNNVVKRMHFNQLLGIRVTRTHKDGVTIECPLRQELMNAMGVLHGGVTATMADAAVGIALWRHNSGSRPHTTVELKINFFRPVWQAMLRAEGTVINRGRTVGYAECTITDEENRLVAKAACTCMVLRGQKAAGR